MCRPRLRLRFTGHDCQTAGYAKLSGLKNGALLTARLADLTHLIPAALLALDTLAPGQIVRVD